MINTVFKTPNISIHYSEAQLLAHFLGGEGGTKYNIFDMYNMSYGWGSLFCKFVRHRDVTN